MKNKVFKKMTAVLSLAMMITLVLVSTAEASAAKKDALSQDTAYFINQKTAKLISLTAGNKRITVKWKKPSGLITGYQIQYSPSSTFSSSNKTVKIKSANTTNKTISGLKSGKQYYVRIRTYKTVNGKTGYSAWSNSLSCKVKSIDLSKYLGVQMSVIEKQFKGGTHPQRMVAETGFYDLGWLEFSYGVPVTNPKAESVILKEKKPGYSIFGVTLNISETKAINMLQKKGWKVDNRSYGTEHSLKFKKAGTTNYLTVRIVQNKVARVAYCEDLS